MTTPSLDPRLTLEQLLNVQVTSVSKKSEKASEAPAAIFVITQDDIRRSGATSLPDVLRMVPGIQVAQEGSGEWAVTSRGFNDQFANKMLVLMDGRTLYTPIFAGVYWDAQYQPMDNIERIEVIRGPGATLWGANAVNGIINIITKNAEDTQGAYSTTYAGNQEVGGDVRYGGRIGDKLHYRAYVSRNNHDELNTPQGTGADDDWNLTQSGFRMDWDSQEQDTLTLQGDYYGGTEDFQRTLPSLTAPFSTVADDDVSFSGFNVLSKWQRTKDDGAQTSVQVYYDYNDRNREIFGDHEVNTLDVEFQNSLNVNASNQLVWGLGYRLVWDDLSGSFYISYDPQERTTQLFSGFVQDKYELINDQVYLTLGTKLEHNDFSGFEVQPNARLSWLIDDRQTFWTSVSRAIRSPNRSADDFSLITSVIPGATPALIRFNGDRDANDHESLVAYEIGYRAWPVANFSYDITAFYNDYKNLIYLKPGALYIETMGFPPHPVIPLTTTNAGTGETYGTEIAMNWEVLDYWKLAASYSFLIVEVHGGTSLVTSEGTAPENQFNVRSYLDLPYDWEFDNFLYYNDNLSDEGIPAYFRFDTRIGWRPTEGVELSLVGQNLFDPQHPEFSPFIFNLQEQVPRAFYGRATFRF